MAKPFQALVWESIDADAPVNDPIIARNHRQWSAGRPSKKADDYAEIAHGRLHVLWIFGRNMEGESIAVKTPCPAHLFVDAPKNWGAREETVVGEELYRCIEYQYPGSLLTCKFVERKKFFGYHGDRSFGFYRVEFASTDALRMCSNVLRKRALSFKQKGLTYTFTVYESNVDPIIRFMHDHTLESTGWMQTSGVEPVPAAKKETTCALEYHCKSGDQITPCTGSNVAPFVQVSFDIECASVDDAFPDALRDGCEVIQIGSTVQILGQPEPTLRHIVTLKACNPIPGVEVESYETEKEVIEAFARLLRRIDADIMLGWNTFQFDMDYIFKRAVRCKIRPLILGRLADVESTSREMTLQSAAFGSNTYNLVTTPGILHLDVMEAVKREHKLASYSLKEVSKTVLPESGADNAKVDLPPKEIFRLFREGDPKGITQVAEYCVQDTALPLKIANTLCTVGNAIEMAKCSCVPVDYLLKRGMQVKVFALILKYTMSLGYVIPVAPRDYGAKRAADDKNDKYEGATVLDAKSDVYMRCIVTLDFASLYPRRGISIIRAHNMSYDTLVMDAHYLNLPGVEYDKFEWEEASGTKTAHFVQNREGVLPKLLNDLAVWRKDAKQVMAAAERDGDKALEAIMNGKQLAYKIMMNSVYGFCGATRGMLPCVEIAAAVTSTGRNMIDHSKRMVESHYQGSQVIYGDTDSIFVSFKDDLRDMHEAFRLGNEASEMITKTFKRPNKLEFEKVYCPLLLIGKKRYTGLKYEKDPNKPKGIDTKGLQLVRRDSVPLVREVSNAVLDSILYKWDVMGARVQARKVVRDLLEGRIPIEKLTLTKALRTGYKNLDLPHLAVARKMEKRDPGSGPKPGDRVPYVLIDTGNPKDKQSEKAEDPAYAVRMGLPLDTGYYMEHQLKTPLVTLLGLFVKNGNPAEQLYGDLMRAYKNGQKKQRMIDTMFKKQEPSTNAPSKWKEMMP